MRPWRGLARVVLAGAQVAGLGVRAGCGCPGPEGRGDPGYDGTDQPASQVIIDLLMDGFKTDAAAGKVEATAIIYDILVVPPGVGSADNFLVDSRCPGSPIGELLPLCQAARA